MRAKLTANHGGRFAFQICDRMSNLDHACFNRFLTRADIPGERYWWLFSSSTGDFSMVGGITYFSELISSTWKLNTTEHEPEH
jgi:hypothetical protein